MSIINIKIIPPEKNIGDLMCSPLSYFPFNQPSRVIDILHVKKGDISADDVVIFGGGGIMFYLMKFFSIVSMCKKKGAITVAWGIGENDHKGTEPQGISGLVGSFDLCGMRDKQYKNNWLPCVSCMHPAFNNIYEQTEDIVVYSHHQGKIESNYPTMYNRLYSSNTEDYFKNVIKFLGSASIVVTNTYHGMYWATLLGKLVILYKPFSSRFGGFPYNVEVIDSLEGIPDALERSVSHSNALEECREANVAFAEQVRILVSL